MSVSLELNCCGGLSSIKGVIMGWVDDGSVSPVALTQLVVLDCTVCLRMNPTCISSFSPEPIRLCSLLPDAIKGCSSDTVELIVDKLCSDGIFDAAARLGVQFPLSVAPVLAESTKLDYTKVALNHEWETLFLFAQAGVLDLDLSGHLQRWVPHSLEDSARKIELFSYFAWLRQQGSRAQASRIVWLAVKCSLKKHKLPEEILSLIGQMAGLGSAVIQTIC